MAVVLDQARFRRDTAVDAARVLALVTVVLAHLLLVTLVTDPRTGQAVNVMVPTLHSWFWWVSWIVQIMPLFFIVGGFASATSWGHSRERGADPVRWMRVRLIRIVQPAALLWCVLAAITVTARVLGAPEGYVTAALQGVGMHLWFLAAYIGCILVVPVTYGAHRRHPFLSLAVLVALAAACDGLRVLTGNPWWALLAVGPVWLSIHQLGYFRYDGWFARAPTGVLLVLAGGCYAALWLLTRASPWPQDMLSNLNPPTMCLVLLGVAQACLLQVATPALKKLMQEPPVQALAWLVGARPVTLYLWHLPVIVVVAAAWWLVDGPSPEPGSTSWWLWRIPVAVVCVALMGLVVRLLGWFETSAGFLTGRAVVVESDGAQPVPRVSPGAWWAVVAAGVLVIVPALLEIRYLLHPVLVYVGAVAYVAAVVTLRVPGPHGRSRSSGAPGK